MDFSILKDNSFYYFDHAATTFMPDEVISAWTEYQTSVGIYYGKGANFLNSAAYREYAESCGEICGFFSLSDHELIFGKNVTELINSMAFMLERNVRPMDIIAVGPYEHHSNLLPWKYMAQRRDALFVELPTDRETGKIDYEFLGRIKDRLKILSVSSVCNTFGAITDIEELERHINPDTVLLVDESQLAAHGEIYDSERISAHFLPSHKMYGPKGIAACAVRKSFADGLEPCFLGGGMVKKIGVRDDWQKGSRRFEAGTYDVGAIRAWAQACRYIERIGRDEIRARTERAYALIHSAAESNSRLDIISDKVESAHSIISVCHSSIHAHDFEKIMADNDLIIRSGHICSQNSLRKFGLTAINRISLGLCMTDEGIGRMCEVLAEI